MTVLRIVELFFFSFSQFFKKYLNLPSRVKVSPASLKIIFTMSDGGVRLMLDGGVSLGLWFQFTSSSLVTKFYWIISWHEPLILVWLVPPSQWTRMGALSKGRPTGSIMISTFGWCSFGIFLQGLFCFLFWFYSFVNLLLKIFLKKDLLFLL